MTLEEYARHDATSLAALVAKGEVTPRELAANALRAVEAVNSAVNAVVETYPDRIEGLDEATLGKGPFRGVPYLMKDVWGHEAGRRMEFGSRLCRGMVTQVDSAYCRLIRAAGFNILGRSAAPEFSMAGTTEGALHGNTSTPWRAGHSAGGSSGGAMAAVVAGIVPAAHGSDIAGSVRIPASFCGGVGFKPSRGRVSFAPLLDENGYGLGQNFAQAKSVRDVAAILDAIAVPQPGDPFLIPRPARPWAHLAREAPPRLRVGYSTAASMGVKVDPEVAAAVEATARALAGMGHDVEEDSPEVDGLAAMRSMMDLWFFGFDGRIAAYSKRTGLSPGPDTLEPVVREYLRHAREMTSAQFMAALAHQNVVRRQWGAVFARRDVWITPTTARVAEPWGRYNLGRADVRYERVAEEILGPVAQHTLPHNIMGTPAISLPLAMHSSGLPIGVQVAAGPANEHVVLQVAAALEQAMPWADRVPPLHVSRPEGAS